MSENRSGQECLKFPADETLHRNTIVSYLNGLQTM